MSRWRRAIRFARIAARYLQKAWPTDSANLSRENGHMLCIILFRGQSHRGFRRPLHGRSSGSVRSWPRKLGISKSTNWNSSSGPLTPKLNLSPPSQWKPPTNGILTTHPSAWCVTIFSPYIDTIGDCSFRPAAFADPVRLYLSSNYRRHLKHNNSVEVPALNHYILHKSRSC